MDKKILFCTGEGIGNTIQTIPVIRTIKENFAAIDLWHAFGNYSIHNDLIPYVDKCFVGSQINTINPNNYKGKVSTFWTRQHQKPLPLNLLNKIQPLSMARSEVDTYMDIARDLGVQEKDLIWHGECNYNNRQEKFDIVISDGYNRYGSARWEIKSYSHYEKLVEYLNEDGYSVCSIGAPNEYVKGTVNMTGLSLLDSLGIIKNSSFLISNDSGMYHCANALRVHNLVIFTATSIEKNYDERFHKYSTLMYRNDLKCRPCQSNRKWAKDCNDWKCKDIDPEYVAGQAMLCMFERRLDK